MAKKQRVPNPYEFTERLIYNIDFEFKLLHLWQKGILPNIFDNMFQHASNYNIRGYNTSIFTSLTKRQQIKFLIIQQYQESTFS